jgi:hypothetical protein
MTINRAKEAALAPAMLKELFDYSPETGELTWRRRSDPALAFWNNRFAGKRAGSQMQGGHREVFINAVRHREHRVIWAWMTGKWPLGEIDHKNRIRHDNRWENLRDVSTAQNAWNKWVPEKNSSGRKGVCWERFTQKWKAEIRVDGRCYTLGRFPSVELAAAAYAEAAALLHGNYACVGRA